jgi:hypothetical protein
LTICARSGSTTHRAARAGSGLSHQETALVLFAPSGDPRGQ